MKCFHGLILRFEKEIVTNRPSVGKGGLSGTAGDNNAQCQT
jgi:hypothetical protein